MMITWGPEGPPPTCPNCGSFMLMHGQCPNCGQLPSKPTQAQEARQKAIDAAETVRHIRAMLGKAMAEETAALNAAREAELQEKRNA